MKTLKQIAAVILCSCFVFISVGAIAQAKTNAPVKGTYRNMYEMLKEVPGVDVISTGKSGRVTIRGMGSLTQQGQPLFVIDGSVYSGEVGDLNPEDIESISVLKDAASQTAYGSRGMFGVIVITSKGGKGVGTVAASVNNHEGSAYTYFIEHKTPLRFFDSSEAVIFEGIIQKQKGDSLVFIKKRKDFLIAISSIKRVEMIPQQ